jgi:hypothetical protein
MSDQNVGFPSRLEIAGIAAALLPFICKASQTSTKTVNGRVVEHTSTDYAAILAGVVAIGIAVALLVTIFPNIASHDRLKHLGVVVVIGAIGAYQLLVRGLGIV